MGKDAVEIKYYHMSDSATDADGHLCATVKRMRVSDKKEVGRGGMFYGDNGAKDADEYAARLDRKLLFEALYYHDQGIEYNQGYLEHTWQIGG